MKQPIFNRSLLQVNRRVEFSTVASETDSDSKQEQIKTKTRWISVILIFVCFGVYAGQMAPDINESHYLCKAKHYWNPDFCPNDLFLASSYPHLLFYWLFGWLTLLFNLSVVAWIGRILTWFCLAFAFEQVGKTLFQKRWMTVICSLLFLVLLDRCHMAGEWVVGGLEAKGFAFSAVLMAISSILQNRWSHSWIWFGIASAFHVLVGGWSCLAAIILFLVVRYSAIGGKLGMNCQLSSQFIALLIGGTISLLGVLPPIMANSTATSAVVSEANRIIVTQRLAHHQYFEAFSTYRVAMYSLMVFAWAAIANLSHLAEKRLATKIRLLNAFAGISLLFCVGGITLNAMEETSSPFATQAINLLIYYWFRISDFAVPFAFAFQLIALIECAVQSSNRAIQNSAGAFALVVIISFAAISWDRWADGRPFADRRTLVTYEDDDKRTIEHFRNWKKVCRWISENTPEDSVFLTPARQQTFKWYAGRTEVVNWKDAPQEASGILEWYQRVVRFHRPQLQFEEGLWAYDDKQLQAIADEFEVTHIVTLQSELQKRRFPSPGFHQVYPENRSEKATYVVFELRVP